MLAFGLPIRSIVGATALENALVGVLGTVVGLGLGWLVIRWMTGSLLPEVLPDVEVDPHLSLGSIAEVLVVGIGAMALAPLLTLRRLLRLDIPSALRVVERAGLACVTRSTPLRHHVPPHRFGRTT